MAKRYTVMVVDDNENFRWVIKRQLCQLGYCAITAYSGEDAVEKYKAIYIDVVLMDLNMGGINGKEAQRKLLEIDPKVKTIVCSGSQFDIEQERELGFVAYLPKIHETETLERMLKDVLGKQ